jgi:hypothetical protein
MASYASYKKISGVSIDTASLTAAKFNPDARKTFGVQWFFGSPNACSTGCCCLWTVPTGVTAVNFEVWGSGGSGAGACSTSRCQHWRGSGGGAYNSKIITVSPGWTYTICAAGNGPCCRFECQGCWGCASYVNGCNLSNFCGQGGSPGCATGDWTTPCHSAWDCCLQGGNNGGDFGYMNHSGAFGAVEWWFGVGFCHCHHQQTRATSAPLIGTEVQMAINFCWMRCACWTVPYGHGGQNAMSSYCGGGNCCGQGNMGGPGLVRATYY